MIRGLTVCNGLLYGVADTFLFSMTPDWTPTVYHEGPPIKGTGPCQMLSDGTYISVCNGERLYVFTCGTGSWADVRAEVHIGYQDTYLLAVNPNSQTFSISSPNNPREWNDADYGTIVGRYGLLRAVTAFDRVVYLFADNSYETWVDTGAADFPFQRTSPGLAECGCLAPASVCMAREGIMLLDQERRVCLVSGLQWAVVSPPELTRRISLLSRPDLAQGDFFVWRTHACYALTFPADDISWVYDLSTQSWFQWTSKKDTGFEHAFRGIALTRYGADIVCGDRRSNKVYRLNPTLWQDDGDEIRRRRTLPPVHTDGKRFKYNRFELEMKTGVSAPGQDARVMLDYSDDAGRTWHDERWESVGSAGHTDDRVRFLQLGSGYNRSFRVTMTDNAESEFYLTAIDAEPGIH